jgi:hypothetical protein
VVRRKAPKRLAFSGVDRLVFETPPVRAEFLEVCNPGFGSPLGALKYAGMPAQVAPRRVLIAVAAAKAADQKSDAESHSRCRVGALLDRGTKKILRLVARSPTTSSALAAASLACRTEARPLPNSR